VRRAAALAAALLCAGCGSPPELDGPTFRDDFSSERSGWPVGPRIGYAGGELRLHAVRAREAVYAALPAMREDARNMVVEADVRIARGAVAGAGITCRAGTDVRSPELYAFIVTADGFVQILRTDRRGIRSLAGGRAPVGAAAVRRGVRLRASCLRRDLAFDVDGRRALAVNDRGVRHGRAGVVLLAGDDPSPEARFDRFVVRTGR
jgi:choline dehydrogenase-like flavoprotein